MSRKRKCSRIYDRDTNSIRNHYTLYDKNGYVKYDSLLSNEVVSKLNKQVDYLQKILRPSDTVFDEDKTGLIKQIQYLHNYHPVFQEVIDKMRPLAEELLNNNNLFVLNMQLFEKHPNISKPTRAHQDNAYFKLKDNKAVTFWIALDDIDEDNGCLYYTPKSHLCGVFKHSRYHKNTTFRVRSGVPGLSLCLHEHFDENDTPMPVKAGDVLAHHCNLVHRAGKNNSNRRRRAIGIVFIVKDSEKDPVLMDHFKSQLKEDIELQKVKDPQRYRQLSQMFSDL